MGCCISGPQFAGEDDLPNLEVLPKKRKVTDIAWIVPYLILFAVSWGLSISFIPQSNWDVVSDHSNEEFNKYLFFQAVAKNWVAILSCIVVTIVMTISVIILFQCMSEGLIIALFGFGIVGGICFVLWIWVHYMTTRDPNFLYMGCLFTIVVLFWILFLLLAREKIPLMIMLYTEANAIIKAMPNLVTLGFIIFFCKIAIVVLIIYMVFMVLLSMIDTYNESDKFTKKDEGQITAFSLLFIWCTWTFFLFDSFWIYIVAQSSATWYFARDKNTIKSPILKATGTMFKYHIGTLSFGSAILTLFELMRKLLEEMRRRSDFPLLVLVVECIVGCCMAFWQILTTFAYHATAIFGFDFCNAAKCAMTLIKRTESLMVFIFTDFFVMIGVLMVAVVSVAVSTIFIRNVDEKIDFAIYVVNILISGAIPAIVFRIYPNIIQSIYISLCIDIIQNDGISKPYFMSDNVSKYMKAIKVYMITVTRVYRQVEV